MVIVVYREGELICCWLSLIYNLFNDCVLFDVFIDLNVVGVIGIVRVVL